MGECDLYVHGHRNGVGDEKVSESLAESGDGAVEDSVAEPCPEEELTGHFKVAVPPGGSLSRSLAEEDVLPREDVEIEAAEGEDRVVEVVLILESFLSEGVQSHLPIIVC